MKVFLSWSGQISHQVALVLKDWLPSVIQSVEPFLSSEDIDKGARWSADIAKELEASSYGILCLTRENQEAPWLLFEAGALSKIIEKSSVSPFLFDLKRSEVQGPILQFQSVIFNKDDIFKLIIGLNKKCGKFALSDTLLNKTFDKWWPTLEQELNLLKPFKEKPKLKELPENTNNQILEEILELTRINQKILRNPHNLLPQAYLAETVKKSASLPSFVKAKLEEQMNLSAMIEIMLKNILKKLEKQRQSSSVINEDIITEFQQTLDKFNEFVMINKMNYNRIIGI